MSKPADQSDPAGTKPERAGLEVVFEGSRPACAEAALVLEAKSIPFELEPSGEPSGERSGPRWAVSTIPALSAAARDELDRYAMEGAHRLRPPTIVAFEGLGTGTAVFAAVLLATAYCTGIHAFGADWLAAGSLDARTGGAGEWWRAVTALTLHLDQAHLLGNLLFGAVFGTLAAGAFGPGIAWSSILAAGAIADYLDMLIAPSDHRAAGASTAVFAALGLLSGFSWRLGLTVREQWRYRWAPLFGGLFLLTLLGAGGERVDVFGHALGFAMGTLLGWAYARLGIPRTRDRRPQWVAGAAAVAVVMSAWLLALRR